MFMWIGIKLGEKHDLEVFNKYLDNPNDYNFNKALFSSGLFYGVVFGFLVDVFIIANVCLWIRIQFLQVGL